MIILPNTQNNYSDFRTRVLSKILWENFNSNFFRWEVLSRILYSRELDFFLQSLSSGPNFGCTRQKREILKQKLQNCQKMCISDRIMKLLLFVP